METIVRCSEAMRSCPPRLMPALVGCPHCRTVGMIASPAPASCPTCGGPWVEVNADGSERKGLRP